MVNSTLYIDEIKVSYEKESVCIDKPNLEIAIKSLKDMEEGKVHYIEYNNTNSGIGMAVFGDPGVYHIGIVNENTDEIYYYWNGMETTGGLIEINGNLYPKHTICNDFNILSSIVKEFCINGERLEDIKWIYEED